MRGDALAVESSVSLIANATSLGGVRSTIESRRRWEGERVPEGLLRLSVGLEDVDELWADLEQALASAARAGGGTRTHGPRLTNPLLYQLSYSGADEVPD